MLRWRRREIGVDAGVFSLENSPNRLLVRLFRRSTERPEEHATGMSWRPPCPSPPHMGGHRWLCENSSSHSFSAHAGGDQACPLIQELLSHPHFLARICVTAQHRDMLDQVLGLPLWLPIMI